MTEVDAASLRELRNLAASLRDADKVVQAALRDSLAQAVRPLKDELKQSARQTLPSRGGLGEWAADKVSVRAQVTGGTTVTSQVTVSLPGSHDLRGLDRGRVYHPTYGRWSRRAKGAGSNPRGSSPQVVKAGFVSDALKGPIADETLTRIRKALDDITKRIVNGKA